MRNFFFASLACLSITTSLSAQVVTEKTSLGRETAKGVVHVASLAKFLEEHPNKIIKRNPMREEEEEDDFGPQPPEADPALVRHLQRDVANRPAGTSEFPFLPVSPAPADTFLANQSTGTNIPPDTHGAVDSNYAVVVVNSTMVIRNKTTHAAVSTLNLDNFWGTSLLGTGGNSFDPRIYYDAYAKRWILVEVSCTSTFTLSKILIAVSKTSSPTGTWYKYAVDVQSGSNWLDFPTVGYNNKWVVVSGNYFNASGASQNSAVWAFDKATMMAGTSAPFQSFTGLNNFTLAPSVVHNATYPNIWFLAMGNRNASGGGQLVLRKLSGAVGSATLSGTLANPSASSLPAAVNRWQQKASGSSADFAPQLGSTNKLQTNDDRVNNVTFRNGKLWTAHTVFFPNSGTVTRSSIMWWQIDTSGTPNQVGLVDSVGAYYSFPCITVNSANDAVVGYSYFSAGSYPAAAYSYRKATDPNDSMRKMYIFRHGQKWYYETFGGTQNRYGDYSASCVDPRNDLDIWTIQESVPAWTGSASLWDTWWAKIKLANTTSVAEAEHRAASIAIVPNPNGGSFTLELSKQPNSKVSVYMMSMDGRVVYEREFEKITGTTLAIETGDLAAGVYNLNAVIDGEQVTQKVTISR